jgi:hypothetical protein
MTLNGRFLVLAICVFGLATLAPLRRCHQCTMADLSSGVLESPIGDP